MNKEWPPKKSIGGRAKEFGKKLISGEFEIGKNIKEKTPQIAAAIVKGKWKQISGQNVFNSIKKLQSFK